MDYTKLGYRYLTMIGDYWNIHGTYEDALQYGNRQPLDFTIVSQIYSKKHRRWHSIKTETIKRQLELVFS